MSLMTLSLLWLSNSTLLMCCCCCFFLVQPVEQAAVVTTLSCATRQWRAKVIFAFHRATAWFNMLFYEAWFIFQKPPVCSGNDSVETGFKLWSSLVILVRFYFCSCVCRAVCVCQSNGVISCCLIPGAAFNMFYTTQTSHGVVLVRALGW